MQPHRDRPDRTLGGAVSSSAPGGSGLSARTAAPVLGIALAALSLQLLVAGIPDLLDPPGSLLPLWPQSILWALLGIAWLVLMQRSCAHLRRRTSARRVFAAGRPQPDLQQDPRPATLALILFVVAVLSAVIIPPLLVGGWTMQPVELWLGLYGTYGTSGVVATIAWLLFHTGFAALAALAMALLQTIGEQVVQRPWARRVPTGGVLIGLVLGAADMLTGGWADLLTTVVSCTMLGGVLLLLGGRLRWIVPAAWLLLLLL